MTQFSFNLVSDVILSNTLHFSKKDFIYMNLSIHRHICIDICLMQILIYQVFSCKKRQMNHGKPYFFFLKKRLFITLYILDISL